MSLFNVHRAYYKQIAKSDCRGFTLIEIMVVVIFLGIMSAIAAPSVLSSYNRMKLNTALNDLRGSLEESQRTAVLKGKSCPVTLNPTTRTISGDCLLTGSRTIDSSITMSPSTSTTVTFSFKGNTTNSATFILSLADNSNSEEKRCLTISDGLGILRTGIYKNSTSTCESKL